MANVQRIDTGTRLTEAEIDAGIMASWPARRASVPQPIAAECCTDEGAEPVQWPRQRGISVYGVVALLLLVLSASFVGAVIYTGWRLARAFH